MRSFSILSFAVAATSSLFVSAAPIDVKAGAVAGVGADVAARDVAVGLGVDAGVAVGARDAQLDSIPKILEDLTNDLSEVLLEISEYWSSC